MSKLVKRFKSAISRGVTVTCLRGEKSFFYTLGQQKFIKDSNKYEDAPFYDVAGLAALRSALDQAISWAEENPFVRSESNETTDEGSAKSSPIAEKLADMEDIPF